MVSFQLSLIYNLELMVLLFKIYLLIKFRKKLDNLQYKIMENLLSVSME